jgi:two-component system chemotaxis response regulator CheB
MKRSTTTDPTERDDAAGVAPAAEDPLAARYRGAELNEVDVVPTAEIAYRDIVVVGASAGGVEALTRLATRLPLELPAAVFAVLHISSAGGSVLPQILRRAGRLPAAVPEDCERVERGHLYVAPPDRHLVLVGQRIRLTGGPRENGHRPAIDPLFRSAARAYGARVIAVVLSGTLDDGAAGARMVKERGGLVLVQDPDDALYGDMPANTARVTHVDGAYAVEQLADRICELVEEPIDWEEDMTEREERERVELDAAEVALGGTPSELSCPDCGGTLWERNEGPLVRFACRVGHVYSPESLIEGHSEELERALWSALRSLEERGDLYRRLARRNDSSSSLNRRFESRARSADAHATAIREAISKITGSDELEATS